MSDDIVTRLREDFCDFGQWENSCTPEDRCPCCLAADEIERLRTDLKRWENCEMVTESVCGWDSEQTYCDTCKAVRGE